MAKIAFKLVICLTLALSLMSFAPSQSQQFAAASSIIYNLYATDGYVPLADLSAVYMYGFVGGRQGEPLTYQKSVIPVGTRDPVTQLVNGFQYQGNETIPTGAPAPTGGVIAAAEGGLAGNAQFPAPLIWAAVGDVVEIRLKNLGITNAAAPNDPHSIHLHGLDVDAANDGVPETSLGAVPANLCADATSSNDCSANGGSYPGAGNVIVYMFAPKNAGTYMYHCHQEADIHVQMGMFGALVVYSALDKVNANSAYRNGGPGSGFGGNVYGWKYDKDYVLLESELAPLQHVSEETAALPGGGLYNPVDFKPSYWFLNGLSFPNTIHVGLPSLPGGDGWADWIAAHRGYDPFITGSVSKSHTGLLGGVSKGDKVLLRMINMGFETHPMHMHGFHGKVIGSDQRAWYWANAPQQPFGLGLEKNTLLIGSGETYDWLVDFGQQNVTSTYSANTQSRYDANNVPQSNTQTTLPVISEPGAADTYIGGPTVTGAIGIPLASQLFPFHDHDDFKATNNGAYPGGMFTMLMPLP